MPQILPQALDHCKRVFAWVRSAKMRHQLYACWFCGPIFDRPVRAAWRGLKELIFLGFFFEELPKVI
jgi:hypothetical protein